MIPTLKNLLKFFPHTYWLLPPPILRFCGKNIHKCFLERVTIYLKKPRKSAREALFFVLFKLEFRFLQGGGTLQCGTFSLALYFKEQNIRLSSLMSFQNVRNYDTPSWLKPFLFIFKIDK